MEKIVQITIPVPRPEPFALRNMLRAGIDQIATAPDEAGTMRLESVVEQAGGLLLNTPRDVNRVLDSVEYLWPAVQGSVDLADMMWLQIVRNTNPKLYLWIEEYCLEMAALANGNAHVSEHYKKAMRKRLREALKYMDYHQKEFEPLLSKHLPGIDFDWGMLDESEDEPAVGEIFGDVSSAMKTAAIQDKRLASPDHSRFYFALNASTGSVTDADFNLLFHTADEGSEQTKALLQHWFLEPTADSGKKAAAAIGRLSDLAPSALNAERSLVLIRVLADVMDHGAPSGRALTVWGRRTWNEAQRLLRLLRNRVGSEAAAQEAIEAAFREGSAIGWLVHILRAETFAHGRYGNQRTPEGEWLLNEGEFDDIAEIMRSRFEGMSIAEIFKTPDPISLLFAWRQIGDNGHIQSKFQKEAKDDGIFVSFLGNMTTVVVSSSGNYKVIKKEYLALLGKVDELVRRLDEISRMDNPLALEAKEVLRKINIDREI
jgi:hypothetical protein